MREHLLQYLDQAKSYSVRGLRILVEYFYASEIFEPVTKANIKIVSVFGSARLKPGSEVYEAAKELGGMLYRQGFAVVTGASQGVMQAANEGVANMILEDIAHLPKYRKWTKERELLRDTAEYRNQLKLYSFGLKIALPFEAESNPFLGVVATFHYFMVRKFFFGSLSSAFIACEGGWGTRDELFEILTLVQTGKAPLMPIIYISDDPAHLTDDIAYALKKKYIAAEDLNLLQIVDSNKKAVAIVSQFYRHVAKISYDKDGCVQILTKSALTPRQRKTVAAMVEKNYTGVFKEGVYFDSNMVELRGFNYRSYGIVRLIVDAINKG